MSRRGVQANPADDYSARAEGALTQYQAVIATAEENGEIIVGDPTAVRQAIFGIVQEAATASGDRVSVRRDGTSFAIASASATLGFPAMVSDTDGRVNSPTSDLWTSGDGYVGNFDEAPSASGDVVAVKLNISTIMP